MKAPLRPTVEAAELLAIRALTFIAADPERMRRFFAMTGIAPAEIRMAARAPGFLAGVLEHMLGEESLLLAFAASAGIDPGEVGRGRRALGGEREQNAP